MKKLFNVVMAVLMVGLLPLASAQAGEMDILLNKLVEKGILSPLEATIIKDETKQAVSTEVIEGKSYAVPSWVQNTKLKGDFRTRYQYERRDTDEKNRHRGRIRYRLGVIANPLKDITIGAGLASGGADARSTNQTFENAFQTGDIRLDYAYAEYAYNKNLKMVMGKFPRKAWLWAPSDLLWDGDVNPEGATINFTHKLAGDVSAWVNSGFWVLDEIDQTDKTDPYLAFLQSGLELKNDVVDGKLAATYYSFDGVKNGADLGGTGNTMVGGNYLYDYDAISIATELGLNTMIEEAPYRAAIFGEYIHNPDPDKNNNGWIVGAKLGHKKVGKPKTWQVKYQYAKLEKDAWVDFLPDSDRWAGNTDTKGHEVVLEYAIKNNVVLGLDYYLSDHISAAENQEQLIQADVVIKF